ncbi:MAG: alanine--tRNA ligase-related protein, partial [bacterium]
FLTDVFDAAREVLEKRSNMPYKDVGHPKSYIKSFKIILDHMRAAAFMIASGIRPANTEQDYVLRRLIRRAIREADKLGIKDAILSEIAESFGTVYSKQYPFVQAAMPAIHEELEKEETQFRKTLTNGMRELERMGEDIDAFMLFTTYGFPIELTEEIAKEKGLSIDAEKVKKQMQEHQELSRAGSEQKFKGGLADAGEMTTKLHSAHHLLLNALQKVLGSDVHQRGSNITNERLRIDFSYGQKMTPEQIAEVEKIVNGKIAEAIPVVCDVMKKEDAEKLGAEHEFGATYPDMVSVYTICDSIEFCGGPHTSNTSNLGHFKILKEEASSAGVRRIKAVLE